MPRSASACSSGATKDTGTGDRTRESCQDLLGTAGEQWVKDSSARQTGLVDVKDLKDLKAAFYDDARSRDPSSKAVSPFLPSELCRIVVQDQKPHTSRLSISYGASVFPSTPRSTRSPTHLMRPAHPAPPRPRRRVCRWRAP
ncbi:hypothetical protein OG588_29935 [Streptomyces prunicolor]|uniref:hypothetical protein n=1 Tax=Streptomyces prunicolor TaxID=67348 RepID=UPI003867EB90|nr:hypothetical protein OG588_29935 [Streptomyces prunicolor]